MIHTAALIRHKGDYKDLSIDQRRKIFTAIYQFGRKSPIKLKSIIVSKKYTDTYKLLKKQLTMELNESISNNLKYFQNFDKILLIF